MYYLLVKKNNKKLIFFKEVTLKISKHYKKRLKEEKCKSFSSFSSVFKLTSLTNEELDKLKIVAFQGIRIEGKAIFGRIPGAAEKGLWPFGGHCEELPLLARAGRICPTAWRCPCLPAMPASTAL